ncbi:MAG TPA: Rieske (2Fe-2S) protein [Longimicrobiales bacterium]
MPTLLKEHAVADVDRPHPDEEALIPRRTVMKRLAAIAGGITALLASVPSLLAFLTPTLRTKSEVKWLRVGEAALFDIGVPDRVDVNDNVQDAWVTQRVMRSIWLFTEDGEQFTAYNARCPHLGCAYAFDEAKAHFACPCHKGVFDVKTGAVTSGPPPRGLDKLQAKVEDGYVFVAYEDFRLGTPDKVRV